MRVFFLSLLFPVFSLSATETLKKPFDFPKVNALQGQYRIESLAGKKLSVQVGKVLKERVRIQTEAEGRVELQLTPTAKIILHEKSELLIPNIDEELQQIPLLDFKRGVVRWVSDDNKAILESENNSIEGESKGGISLVSQLTQLPLPQVGDVFFEFYPALGYFEVKVVRGEILFGAFNAEEQLLVKSGEKLKFFGEVKNEEIQYDTLLKGRKIPRGKLGVVEKFNYEGELKLQKEKEDRAQAEKKRQASKKRQLLDEQKKRTGEYICIMPRGKLNQCQWRCEDESGKIQKKCNEQSQCVRYRCNAGGEWADRASLIKKEICLQGIKKPSEINFYSLVQACDY